MRSIFLLTVFLTISLIPASADSITILSASNTAGANADLNTWLTNDFVHGSTADTITTFENDADGHYTSLSTGIGTFSAMPGGLGSTGAGTGKNQFSVLDSADSPFNGRYNTTPGGKTGSIQTTSPSCNSPRRTTAFISSLPMSTIVAATLAFRPRMVPAPAFQKTTPTEISSSSASQALTLSAMSGGWKVTGPTDMG